MPIRERQESLAQYVLRQDRFRTMLHCDLRVLWLLASDLRPKPKPILSAEILAIWLCQWQLSEDCLRIHRRASVAEWPISRDAGSDAM